MINARFTMEFAQSGEMALQRIADAAGVSLILILSDINMPGMTGLELLPKAKAARPDVPVIMITAYGDVTPSARHWKGARKRFSPNPSTLAHSVARLLRASNEPRRRRTRLATPDRNVRYWPKADIGLRGHNVKPWR
jgi:DNA-binding NtrC family response regulator